MTDEADFLPLDPSARVLFHLQAFSRLVLFWMPVTAMGAVGGALVVSPFTAVMASLGWLCFLFLMAVWYPFFSFRRWGYLLRENELLIRRGVLFRSITAIPTTRIQHVDTRQGPIEQWMGLARVTIHTASGVGADGIIPGLDIDVAEDLRDELVRVEGDDGV